MTRSLAELPAYMRAPLVALQFTSPDCNPLARLPEEEWTRVLSFCDRTQLTLPLALRCRESLPDAVRNRTARNLAGNEQRWQRVQKAYAEVAAEFRQADIDFALLKGFSHCPHFVADPRWRPQYDMDLLLEPRQLQDARAAAERLRYEPLRGTNDRVDHLPTMIRKTGWEWRGDLFDPEIPISLELHFRLWDQSTEHFDAAGTEAFWARREMRAVDGVSFTALHPVDAVAYASLHLLRHLLRGDAKAFHVYEIASMLDRSAGDEAFWNRWRDWHDPSLRRVEAICFALARRWFHCAIPAAVSEEIELLSTEVARWLETNAFSPLMALARPNKDELWLHWTLIDSAPARWSMVRRRLLPESLPGPVDAVHMPDRDITPRIAIRRKWRYLRYAAARAAHHLIALPGVASGAVQWFAGLNSQYWIFFVTAALYNFGLFVFFFLYNLYLLRLGFKEDFLGLISGVMTAGSVAGCIPAAAAIRRFGMRSTLLAAFVAMAVISALRAVVPVAPVLVGLAFVGGFIGATWGVAISPAIAQLTTERNRPLGFSLIFSSGVAIGVLGGFAGGHLPAGLSQVLSSGVNSYRASLLLGCATVLLALWPLSRLKIRAALAKEPVCTRPSPLLWRFFAAVVVWNMGTGVFNPFFSAFFVHLGLSTQRIGAVFSSVHLAQALAMLAGPLAIRRLGLARGISTMQFATALSLCALAILQGPGPAAIAYGAYMASQYMSEPGVFALLMNSVPETQRAGLSALNMIVMLSAQAAAAGAAGLLITRFGYPSVLTGASLVCAVAAILFRGLRSGRIAPSDS